MASATIAASLFGKATSSTYFVKASVMQTFFLCPKFSMARISQRALTDQALSVGAVVIGGLAVVDRLCISFGNGGNFSNEWQHRRPSQASRSTA